MYHFGTSFLTKGTMASIAGAFSAGLSSTSGLLQASQASVQT